MEDRTPDPAEEPSSFAERAKEATERAKEVTSRVKAWFPWRVWTHFSQHGGLILAAGVSYQALFAVFAAIYVALAIGGIWLGASAQLVSGLVKLLNSYLPGIIGENPGEGLLTRSELIDIAARAGSTLTITGVVAVGVLVWTAIGWITFSRIAVREMFSLPKDPRSFLLLKARDLLVAVLFSIALFVGVVLSNIGSGILGALFEMLGIPADSFVFHGASRTLSFFIAFLIDSAVLLALFRFLTRTQLPTRVMLPGVALGGAVTVLLQMGLGLLLGTSPRNPLLAAFAVFVGLLLWFRMVSVVMLMSAAWVGGAARDRDVPIVPVPEAERRLAEADALVTAARFALRRAGEDLDGAAWWSRIRARRAYEQASDNLRRAQAHRAAAEADAAREERR